MHVPVWSTHLPPPILLQLFHKACKVSILLPQTPTDIRNQMLFHTLTRSSEIILLLFLKLQGLSSPKVSTWLCKPPSTLHLPNQWQPPLQPLDFFNPFSNGLQTLVILVMYKRSQVSTFQIHKNTFLRAYSFVLHSSNEKVGWGTNNVNGMVQLSFLIG